MQTITEIIKDLSVDIDFFLDKSSEITEQDVIKVMDRLTELDNQ